MKKPHLAVLSFLALSFVAACSGGSSAAGTYEMDKEAMKAGMSADAKQNPADVEKGLAMLSGSIELKADGTANFAMKMEKVFDEKKAGKWKLEGTKLTMTLTKDGKEETTTGELVNGVISVEAPGQKMKMTFKKK